MVDWDHRDSLNPLMPFSPPDVSPEITALQRLRYREMSAADKLAIADALSDLAWDAAKAGVRLRNPALDEAGVEALARELFASAPD